jgi:signal transduction histidine kinase
MSLSQDARRLLHLESTTRPRELLTITALLDQARDQVADEAKRRSLSIVVIGVEDEVFVNRAHVQLIVTSLLRDAIDAMRTAGRIAITAQEIEGDLVFAVYDSGRPHTLRVDDLIQEAARALGGRVWRSTPAEGNLALFSLPLYCDDN